MISDVKKQAESRMHKSIASLKEALTKIRTGRAHTSLLDHVMVPYYGSEVPLTQAANVAVADARTLTVTPWEKNMVPAIEKAIMSSDLGLNPVTVGGVMRINLPSLTEDRRRDLIKLVRGEAEGARVAIRNIRRDANNELKKLLKDKTVSEDEERRAQDDVQKLTDKSIAEVDKILEVKETELMEI
jgi:ribosome recycling factor